MHPLFIAKNIKQHSRNVSPINIQCNRQRVFTTWTHNDYLNSKQLILTYKNLQSYDLFASKFADILPVFYFSSDNGNKDAVVGRKKWQRKINWHQKEKSKELKDSCNVLFQCRELNDTKKEQPASKQKMLQLEVLTATEFLLFLFMSLLQNEKASFVVTVWNVYIYFCFVFGN